jgi:DNA-binding NtrC family response regulator
MMELQDLKNRFDIIGNSPALNYALTTAEKVAATDLTVMITGESGTGKDVFSKIIHQISKRRSQPFIAINCGAIPEGTIDSELFGHEKGSFTGATDKRKGYFETVDKGTIFLDEIGEMPLGTQARLLRLLQNGEFIKVGSSTIQKVDVRVIAATNVNLLDQVQKGKFREDLYYRLNTVPIEVPPLRDRGEDIVLLFRKFSADFCEKNKMPPIRLTDESKEVLKSYRWPGNIRQLKNIAEQVNLLVEGNLIYPQDLYRFMPNFQKSMNIISGNNSFDSSLGNEISLKMLLEIKQDINDIKRAFLELTKKTMEQRSDFISYPDEMDAKLKAIEAQSGFSQPPAIVSFPTKNTVIEIDHPHRNFKDKFSPIDPENLNLAEMEKKLIVLALERNKGKRKYAAQELGISERTLYRKIIDYDLEK